MTSKKKTTKKVTAEETLRVTCAVTGAVAETTLRADGELKLPRGWSRVGSGFFSPEGFGHLYVPRAVTVPVDRVVVGYKTPFPEQYDDPQYSEWYRQLYRSCLESWRLVARASNWILFRLAGMDTSPLESYEKDGRKLWKLPKFTPDAKILYGECRQAFPELDSQSFSSVLRDTISSYQRKQRFGVRVLGNTSLVSYRDPQPLPIAEKDSPISLDEQGRVLVRLRIGGEQFVVRLKSCGARFGRQLATLRKVATGEVPRGAIQIRQGANQQILVGVAVYLPRERQKQATETMLVSTATNALLAGEIQGRPVFLMSERQLLRWDRAHQQQHGKTVWDFVGLDEDGQAEKTVTTEDLRYLTKRHQDRVQSMGEDRKAERRGKTPYGYEPETTPRQRQRHARNFARSLDRRCDKTHRVISDALHKIASAVVNHAVRRNVCGIIYNDLERSYIERFPYARLRTLITEKADRFGITVQTVSVTAEKEAEEVAHVG